MLNWNDYPAISTIKGEEVFLETPYKKEFIMTVENLKQEEYLVVQDFDLMPYKNERERYKPREFLKKGSELKIRVIDEPAKLHFERELKRFELDKPKRCYKWHNPQNRTSVSTTLSNLIDGQKIFSYSMRGEIGEIEVGGHGRTAWLKVPSRTDENKHRVIFNPLPSPHGMDWYNFKSFCNCGERAYYGNVSTKYVNCEIYNCAHGVAGYFKTMRVFHEIEGNERVPAFFPKTEEKGLKFNENLAKTFMKKDYKVRLNKAEREIALCGYQSLVKDCFSFKFPFGWEQKVF